MQANVKVEGDPAPFTYLYFTLVHFQTKIAQKMLSTLLHHFLKQSVQNRSSRTSTVQMSRKKLNRGCLRCVTLWLGINFSKKVDAQPQCSCAGLMVFDVFWAIVVSFDNCFEDSKCYQRISRWPESLLKPSKIINFHWILQVNWWFLMVFGWITLHFYVSLRGILLCFNLYEVRCRVRDKWRVIQPRVLIFTSL